MATKRQPVTAEERKEIRRLHGEGWSRNRIAKHLHRSGRTISKEVERMGLTFDRSVEVAAATEARRIDLEARRVKLAEDLQVDAERIRAQLWEPTVVYNFGGRDNTYEEHRLPEAPADVKRTLLSAVGVAVDRSLKLSPPKDETGNEEGLALITKLMSGLTAVYEAQKHQGADEGA
ncbi:helix-turn-helix domain-containing protein [Streptomyces sp. PR69]|uniref:helix-turn-helix domain-containing protein n=1 Tax=Streptomyces sp. PR69 TaxID=2984950 RepID=UPI0022647F28|nr:helix-turn-helix domain-containing protein [Streptomyces sp. PR69]